ncbi:MAG: hypothetical protein ACI8PP_002115 [Candidatus Pseudothioglobus sp.]|jgi:uncharacterized protein YcgL (UPF0745 family)
MVTCDVYKSDKKAGLYLYVDHAEGLVRVPETLLLQFGPPRLTLSFELHGDRRMARQDPQVVLKNLSADGYHIQLPPAPFLQNTATHSGGHNAPAKHSEPDASLARGSS